MRVKRHSSDTDRIAHAPYRDVTSETEVLGLENLIGAWVVENGLGVNASLVRESAISAAVKIKYMNYLQAPVRRT